MRPFSISIAIMMCGAAAMPLLAARTPAATAKMQPSREAVDRDDHRVLHERNQRQNRPPEIERHEDERGHFTRKHEKEDEDGE